MSFEKALVLLRLADVAASRHGGVTLEEIREDFRVSHRTAQRMTAALVACFPHAVNRPTDELGRARWRMREAPLARLRLDGEAELSALELAVRRLRSEGETTAAATLASLRDRLLAAIPATAARRAEADAETLLEAHELVTRQGPALSTDPVVVEAVTEALRGPSPLAFDYGGARRIVEPYGILVGVRRYLVARRPDKGPEMRRYRLDRIQRPEVLAGNFERDPAFDLQAYAARDFGSWHDEAEYGEVIWRFSPDAAERAAEWRFHPRQETRRLPDGGLEVRFHAGGWLEMAWHLYCWGDAVEVVAPEALKRLVADYRRPDFGALP